jgi:hypothetical protein
VTAVIGTPARPWRRQSTVTPWREATSATIRLAMLPMSRRADVEPAEGEGGFQTRTVTSLDA